MTRAAGARLLDEWLGAFGSATQRAYVRAAREYASHLGVHSAEAAVAHVVAHGPGSANRAARDYRRALVAREIAPATTNLRLTALRSLTAFLRTVGEIEWTLVVPGVRTLPYRDMHGPDAGAVGRMLQLAGAAEGSKALRDRAILRLLTDLALRRGEVVSLDLAHVDLTRDVIRVLGKGCAERSRLTLPAPTRDALQAWMRVRGERPGPLFPSLLRSGSPRIRGGRLRRIDGSVIHRMVRRAGMAVGAGPVRPHGLRHAAITQALALTNGNLRAAQRFSRHADPRVLVRYDDSREDVAGQIAAQVAAW